MQLTTRRHLPPQSCCIHSQESGLTTHVRVRARAGASGKVEAYDIEITAADSLPSIERRGRESARRSRRANERRVSRCRGNRPRIAASRSIFAIRRIRCAAPRKRSSTSRIPVPRYPGHCVPPREHSPANRASEGSPFRK